MMLPTPVPEALVPSPVPAELDTEETPVIADVALVDASFFCGCVVPTIC
jgi:hypothetical protein